MNVLVTKVTLSKWIIPTNAPLIARKDVRMGNAPGLIRVPVIKVTQKTRRIQTSAYQNVPKGAQMLSAQPRMFALAMKGTLKAKKEGPACFCV